MIIAGFKNLKKVLGQAVRSRSCRHCGERVRHLVVREKSWFALFWIPVFPGTSTYYQECPVCCTRHKISLKDACELLEVNYE